jgi:hypothetical protein
VYYEDAHEHDMPFEDFRGSIDGLCKEHAERVYDAKLSGPIFIDEDTIGANDNAYKEMMDIRHEAEKEVELFRYRPTGKLTDEQESRMSMYLDIRPKLRQFDPNANEKPKPYQEFLLG